MQQLARFWLTQLVARSVCGSRASCTQCAVCYLTHWPQGNGNLPVHTVHCSTVAPSGERTCNARCLLSKPHKAFVCRQQACKVATHKPKVADCSIFWKKCSLRHMTRAMVFRHQNSKGQMSRSKFFRVVITIRYDTRRYFNVRSRADISQLNLPHGTDN